jgi:hypothetical protein
MSSCNPLESALFPTAQALPEVQVLPVPAVPLPIVQVLPASPFENSSEHSSQGNDSVLGGGPP